MTNFLITLLSIIVSCRGESLFDPDRIILNDGDEILIIAQYCNHTVISNGDLYLNMTAVCFCYFNPDSGNAECSIPGPTLIMYNGTSVNVTYASDLYGARDICASEETCDEFNWFTDLDVFNMHLHGVYIDPTVGHDDVVFTDIRPDFDNITGDVQLYNYPIIAEHYPGTFWYHTHHHGAITFHLSVGMFGAVFIEHPDADYAIDAIKDNVLFFSWIQAVNASTCLPCGADSGYRGGVPNLCTIYCSYPESKRNVSGYTYDVKSDFDDMDLFLVNGQYQPDIDDMFVDTYRRLRFVNAMEGYWIQYKFPAACDWYQVGADGYFLEDTLDLSAASHANELILPMGARADVLVKCDTAGTYDILSSQTNTQSTELANLNRITADIVLFSLVVSEYDELNTDPRNNVTALPAKASYPAKPYYLSSDISSDDDLLRNCVCNSYDDLLADLAGSELEDGRCFIQMHGTNLMNGFPFKLGRPITQLQPDSKFEFTFYPTNGHILHLHQFPIQVQSDIASSFIAAAYEWRDTVGNYDNSWKFRFYTYDYQGAIVVHCHVVRDADMGMATYFVVTDGLCNPVDVVNVNSSSTEAPEPTPTEADKTGSVFNSMFVFGVVSVAVLVN